MLKNPPLITKKTTTFKDIKVLLMRGFSLVAPIVNDTFYTPKWYDWYISSLSSIQMVSLKAHSFYI